MPSGPPTPLRPTDVQVEEDAAFVYGESSVETDCLLLPASSRPPDGPLLALFVCFLLTIVVDVGGGLTAAPEVRLLENAVCRAHYRVADPCVIGLPPSAYVDESLCKIDEVQVHLAYLRAWKRWCDTLPGALLSLHYGRLADRWGRKPILILGIAGVLLAYFWVLLTCYCYDTFAPEHILFSSVFLLLGGGYGVITAVLNSIIVDVTTREKRGAIFYIVGGAIHVTDIIAPLIGSWLLSRDLWLPYKVASPVMLSSLIIVMLLPETLQARVPGRTRALTSELVTEGTTEGTSRGLPRTSIEAILGCHEPESPRTWRTWRVKALRFISDNDQPLICLVLTLVHSFSTQSAHLLLQVVSKRLGWSLASAGYILSWKATVCILVLMVVVPGLRQFLVKRRHWQLDLDKTVCQASLALLAIGNVATGSASRVEWLLIGITLTSLGTAFPQSIQGLLGRMADGPESSRTATLFAGQSLVGLAGMAMGTVVMAALFAAGSSASHGEGYSFMLGLPFFFSALLFAIALGCSQAFPNPIEDDCEGHA
ncbi:major facilitator superfamily domain-containing protein [Nemania abortiva]|nr:major facilitator superfamily domain-containing protein [Nemania abortiva]